MLTHATALPLAFAGHAARVLVTPLGNGRWHVEAQVDGRTLGWEEYANWPQVEHFRERMQRWVKQAEDAERNRSVEG
jgi:hypothetical protein